MHLRLRSGLHVLTRQVARTLPCLLACAALSLFAGEPARRTFRVEAGDAASTLREFAAQAAEQVVFPAEAVRGVTTHAIRGEFTPREALNRMTAGTALVVMQDERTGALSVKKAGAEKNEPSRPGADRAAAAASGETRRATGTGAIEGRVKNAATGAYLNNARVTG